MAPPQDGTVYDVSSNSYKAAWLSGFGVGKARLKTAHAKWLRDHVMLSIESESSLDDEHVDSPDLWQIWVIGSASRTGSFHANLSLSRRRAEAVRAFLGNEMKHYKAAWNIDVLALSEVPATVAGRRNDIEYAFDRAVLVIARTVRAAPNKPPPPQAIMCDWVRQQFSHAAPTVHARLLREGVEIVAIDRSDWAGRFAAWRTLPWEFVPMSDVKSMVTNVLQRKCDYKIRRLTIVDHGVMKTYRDGTRERVFEIGNDDIGLRNLKTYEPELSRLRGEFHKDGSIWLQNCYIGTNTALLIELAKMLDVLVYAGTGADTEWLGFGRSNSGDYVVAFPGGYVMPAYEPD
jgi:hypothetical protein